jgi:hypothetical protein
VVNSCLLELDSQSISFPHAFVAGQAQFVSQCKQNGHDGPRWV